MLQQLATSLQYVPATVGIVGLNPTSDPVYMGFTQLGVAPQAGDWKTAIWNTSITLGANQYQCMCLVGPGGTVTLTTGTYSMWVKIVDNPETPEIPAGELEIY